MQKITGNPRQGLDPNRVLNLLTRSASVEYRGGVEQFDKNLDFVADLSGYLQQGSSVTSDCTAKIHRSCTLILDSDTPFNYLSDYIKPYVVMTDTVTGFTARFNLGVYTLTSPTPDLTLTPGTSNYTGYDLLAVLNQPIGNSYEIPAGTDPLAQVQSLVSAAFPDGASLYFQYTPAVVTTPDVYSWPFDGSNSYTYLDIINSLLILSGYGPLWVDPDGVFQMHPYTSSSETNQAVEWRFDLSATTGSVVADSRSVYQDVFDTPNSWVYVMSNLDAPPVEGTTQFSFVDVTTPVTSVPARGRVVRKTSTVDALDYPALVAAATQDIEADLLPAETFAISTYPLPLFWHRDIASYNDPVLGTIPPLDASTRRTMVVSWMLPLDANNGDMQLTLATTSSAATRAGTTG
jgi:hypothetical protein